MLDNCTNSSCSTPFRDLAEGGELFWLEGKATSAVSKTRTPEYFWICERCSARMTLCLSEAGTVMAMALQDEPDLLGGVNRENGLRLRSVNIFRKVSSAEGNDLGNPPYRGAQRASLLSR
jgi:hypothetical protein